MCQDESTPRKIICWILKIRAPWKRKSSSKPNHHFQLQAVYLRGCISDEQLSFVKVSVCLFADFLSKIINNHIPVLWREVTNECVKSKSDAFHCLALKRFTRWWFQLFFVFTPNPGEMIQFDEHLTSIFFKRGLIQPPTSSDLKCYKMICSSGKRSFI